MGLKNIIKNFHTADIAWQYRRLRFTPFHPVFWSHIKIYDAILSVAYKANGVMLDAGCGIKPYEELFDGFVESYLGLEYSTNSGYIGHKADINWKYNGS